MLLSDVCLGSICSVQDCLLILLVEFWWFDRTDTFHFNEGQLITLLMFFVACFYKKSPQTG